MRHREEVAEAEVVAVAAEDRMRWAAAGISAEWAAACAAAVAAAECVSAVRPGWAAACTSAAHLALPVRLASPAGRRYRALQDDPVSQCDPSSAASARLPLAAIRAAPQR